MLEFRAKAKTKRDDEIQKGLQSGELDDNIYRGQGGYRNYHKIRSEAHTKENLAVKGPVRGNNFFRATIRIGEGFYQDFKIRFKVAFSLRV